MSTEFFSELYANRDQQIYKYFDGVSWKESSSGERIDIHTPIDGSRIGSVQAITAEEANAVIIRATAAQADWQAKPMYERIAIVKQAAQLLREHQDHFIQTLIVEIGKSKDEARSEILRTADLIEYFAAEAQSLCGEYRTSDTFPGVTKGKHTFIRRAAHGVVLAIGPFNYPVNLTASKIAPGLLMGNSVVFKPPTQGSIVGLMLTYLFETAGVSEGVLSCITGKGKDIGDSVVSHKGIAMIAFTGSTNVGTAIAKKAGMTPLLFECGGNNGVIVLENADFDLAAKEIVKGAFAYAGQRCTGIKYVLATETVLQNLIPRIQQQAETLLHMGDPREESTKLVGPVINAEAVKEVETAIAEAVSRGAEIVFGGKSNQNFMEPTLLTKVTPAMSCVATEIFGPLLSCVATASVDDAIQIINSSDFGLQASVFCEDEGTAYTIAEQLHVGTVQINGSPQRGPDHFPFMGIKASGVGVQGVRYSLEAMSRLTSVVINNPA